jgi:hypothetical protein
VRVEVATFAASRARPAQPMPKNFASAVPRQRAAYESNRGFAAKDIVVVA